MGNFRSTTVIDKSRVADQIFRDLRDSIVRGTVPQGTKLPSERELAQRYGVSGPTVREAIRGLTLLGLADVRHGSGAYVTANTSALLATSLGAVIQLEKPEMAQVLDVSGVLNVHAAGLAASAGTREDHHRIRTALDALDQVKTSETAAEAVRDFHHSIAVASHNGLLVALCGFLVEVQTELGYELMGSSAELWQKLFAKLKPIRADLVDAVIQRNPEAAVTSAREFHAKAVHLLTSLPKAKEVRLADPKLRDLLLSMMSRVGSG